MNGQMRNSYLLMLPSRISYFELGRVAVPNIKLARPTRSILAKLNSSRVGLPQLSDAVGPEH